MVFADTSYWVALFNPDDQWARAARRAKDAVGAVQLLTTDEVLNEFATIVGCNEYLRLRTVDTIYWILRNPNVKVVPQSRDSFRRGVEFFSRRLDKDYSLTDCIAMSTMHAEGITQVLTSDHHFEQEGFKALMIIKQ